MLSVGKVIADLPSVGFRGKLPLHTIAVILKDEVIMLAINGVGFESASRPVNTHTFEFSFH